MQRKLKRYYNSQIKIVAKKIRFHVESKKYFAFCDQICQWKRKFQNSNEWYSYFYYPIWSKKIKEFRFRFGPVEPNVEYREPQHNNNQRPHGHVLLWVHIENKRSHNGPCPRSSPLFFFICKESHSDETWHIIWDEWKSENWSSWRLGWEKCDGSE